MKPLRVSRLSEYSIHYWAVCLLPLYGDRATFFFHRDFFSVCAICVAFCSPSKRRATADILKRNKIMWYQLYSPFAFLRAIKLYHYLHLMKIVIITIIIICSCDCITNNLNKISCFSCLVWLSISSFKETTHSAF